MDPILFLCLLNSKNDQLILTHDKLIVIFKGKSQVFYRSNILKLILTRKKLIVPLVIGGIGASMSVIAMSMGWYYRQLNLIIIFLFLGILYYGITGKDALELFEKGHSTIFLLNKTLPSIQKFLSVFNSSQAHLQYTSQNFIYHLADPKEWESQLTEEHFTPVNFENEGFVHASNATQVRETYQKYYSHKDAIVLLTIVPEFLSAQLKHEYNSDRKESFPHIYGSINKTAIVRLQYYSAETATNFIG
ncbi:DUF952 domain-containing protein [Reichenbachiella sp. MALMAid0571]|uniref:DUF952 domain-containing protein n=1 Tax=Reichenbachiella sp. MALMAid0571 TaxID=3143939 RepID=UPI0032DF255C